MYIFFAIIISISIFLKYPKEIGSFIAKNYIYLIGAISIAAIAITIQYSNNNDIEVQLQKETETKSLILWNSKNFSKEDCLKNAPVIAEDFFRRVKLIQIEDQEPINTINLYLNCIQKLRSTPEFLTINSYIDDYYIKKIQDKNLTFNSIPIMKAMTLIEPNNVKNKDQLRKLESQYTIFKKKQDQESKLQLKAQEKEERKQKKSKGIRIGMTIQNVIDSSWGRPEKINKTITASGTSEQWVYLNGGYLYFENGLLTTIQQ
jgi:hypothetical protein